MLAPLVRSQRVCAEVLVPASVAPLGGPRMRDRFAHMALLFVRASKPDQAFIAIILGGAILGLSASFLWRSSPLRLLGGAPLDRHFDSLGNVTVHRTIPVNRRS